MATVQALQVEGFGCISSAATGPSRCWIGDRAGYPEALGGCSPELKQTRIAALQQEGRTVAFVEMA